MRAIATVLALVAAQATWAVQPDEVLADPALEHRAREIGQMLRCPVCQGENIDESNAPISRDLRLYVRERLVAGDSDVQVIDAVTDRFGEFVLFQPRAEGGNLILYWAGPLMALVAAVGAFLFLRGRRPEAAPAPAGLTAEERARLDALMRDQES
ncbi:MULTISPECIES: cytochrome c-type biogenesis protein [unclassified Paracoccus (in: a-proteobacteria)]|uniref:cytochrome c-type biogenesis protein n=1 Tax=unclassified Paracoccus (in: a-proteobacteria) TaxID=2688777 RepID=UPI00190AB815|nr:MULTISPECIES: cytochrome c-type biogenesis protein [unclassified Paracoccus (in: a-proteobacteria)]QQO46252.1 cytochrome c-type biogenesis protein CcmH [Paracoccus sp. MC1862]